MKKAKFKWRLVHIPRTGGTAFVKAIGRDSNNNKKLLNVHCHSPASRYDEFAPIHLFSFIRNPWDRAVSIYGYLTKPLEVDVQGFREWVAQGCDDEATLGIPTRDEFKLPTCQADYIDRPGVMLYPHEYYQAAVVSICSAICVPSVTVPKRNRTARKAFLSYYDEVTFARVSEVYARDVSLWGEVTERWPRISQTPRLSNGRWRQSGPPTMREPLKSEA